MTALSESDFAVELSGRTDVGTAREENEDAIGHERHGDGHVVVAVADGVSGNVGGATASSMAIASVLKSYREQPADRPTGKRLARAVQQANIDVYDFAVVVSDLWGMATTLTAVAVDQGELTAVHVGDSRLYLIRDGGISQLTKDHTVVAERVRMGLLSAQRARYHPDRSTLTRSLGRELIVGVDRFSRPMSQGDVLLVCSDGLYNVLDQAELASLTQGRSADAACQELIDTANRRGTPDNLSAAVIRLVGPTPPRAGRAGVLARLRALARPKAARRKMELGRATY